MSVDIEEDKTKYSEASRSECDSNIDPHVSLKYEFHNKPSSKPAHASVSVQVPVRTIVVNWCYRGGGGYQHS